MQSHYEINVSLNGSHFFATADRSAIRKSEAVSLYRIIKARFPKDEGFDVIVTCWEAKGFDHTDYFSNLS